MKNRQARSLRELRADVPAELEAVCLKCLHKEPKQRYATAAALAEDLQAWLAGQPVRAPKPPNPHRRWAIAFVGLVLLLGLAIGVYAVATRRDPAPEAPPPPIAQPQQPGEWRSLLTKEPTKLRWPRPGNNSFVNLRPDGAAGPTLTVTTRDLALLSLGDTQASSYQIDLTVLPPVSRNLGIFFGYQDASIGRAPNLLPAHRCQLLEFVSVDTPAGQQYRFDWIDAHYLPDSNLRKFARHLASSQPFQLAPKPHRVQLKVGPSGPSAVTLDGAPIALNVGNDTPAPEAFRGQFGVHVHTSTGVFADAKFLFDKEP